MLLDKHEFVTIVVNVIAIQVAVIDNKKSARAGGHETKENKMAYMGSKARIGKELYKVITGNHHTMRIVEPFLGGGGMLRRTLESGFEGEIVTGDFNPNLTALFKALQQGWLPPETIPTREVWDEVMGEEKWEGTALKGFFFFAGAFRGTPKPKYNHAAFVKEERNAKGELIARESAWHSERRSLVRLQEVMFESAATITFVGGDYREYERFLDTRTAVYCDPPYAGTADYAGNTGEDFDHAAFWETVERWNAMPGVKVFVSEYTAPAHWEVLFTKTLHTGIATRKDGNRGKKGQDMLVALAA